MTWDQPQVRRPSAPRGADEWYEDASLMQEAVRAATDTVKGYVRLGVFLVQAPYKTVDTSRRLASKGEDALDVGIKLGQSVEPLARAASMAVEAGLVTDLIRTLASARDAFDRMRIVGSRVDSVMDQARVDQVVRLLEKAERDVIPMLSQAAQSASDVEALRVGVERLAGVMDIAVGQVGGLPGMSTLRRAIRTTGAAAVGAVGNAAAGGAGSETPRSSAPRSSSTRSTTSKSSTSKPPKE